MIGLRIHNETTVAKKCSSVILAGRDKITALEGTSHAERKKRGYSCSVKSTH